MRAHDIPCVNVLGLLCKSCLDSLYGGIRMGMVAFSTHSCSVSAPCGGGFFTLRTRWKYAGEDLNQQCNVEGLEEKVCDAHRACPWFNALMCRDHNDRECGTQYA